MKHRLPTRLWHWFNAAVATAMLMSGLMILNAHPRLYWGEAGADGDRAWLEIGQRASGEGATRIGSTVIGTDGVLGRSGADSRAFPRWATIPSDYSLADARLWHLAFAWIFAAGLIAYLGWALASRHLAQGVVRGRGGYNRGQRLAYSAILLAVLPGLVMTGLAMSPGMDAGWPWLTAMVGRQSARSLHFIAATTLFAFVIGHIALTLKGGPVRLLWGMTFGRGDRR